MKSGTPMAELAALFPDSPPPELERFLKARKGDVKAASMTLAAHLKWRAVSLPLPPSAPSFGSGLPPWVLYLDGVHARDGSTIVFTPGAMLDPSAGTPMQYAMAASEVLNSRLPPDSSHRVTIMVDTKGIKGGTNPPAQNLVPYLIELCKVLGPNFPERLARLLVYPVPWPARWLWYAIKPFLDPVTAAKVELLPFDAAMDSPERRYPDVLTEHVDMEVLLRSVPSQLFSGGRTSGASPLTSEQVYALCEAGYGKLGALQPGDRPGPPARTTVEGTTNPLL